jgi:hypothetical protein
MASRPACDRHPNLQMIRCSASGYVCPVPGCGRYCDDGGYFDAEVKSETKSDKLARHVESREGKMSMRHNDIDREHPCDGELIELTEQCTRTLTVAVCLRCRTEFRYVPDSTLVTVIYPGMRRSFDWPT